MSKSKSYTVNEATKVLERYCIYQDRCHKEVLQKLKNLHMIDVAQEVIILHLLRHDFLNEERFAKSYARGKFRINKWGKNRIVRELKWRNISAYNIKSALNEINMEDYLETIDVLAKKKKLLIKGDNSFILRKKVFNYLYSKGFETSLINETLDALQ